MARTTNRDAPALIPSRPGSASGLRVTPCISVPARPRAAPTSSPTAVRGSRWSRTTLWSLSPGTRAVRASTTAPSGTSRAPSARLATTTRRRTRTATPSPTRRRLVGTGGRGVSVRVAVIDGWDRRSLRLAAPLAPVAHEGDAATAHAGLAHERPAQRLDDGGLAREPGVEVGAAALPAAAAVDRLDVEDRGVPEQLGVDVDVLQRLPDDGAGVVDDGGVGGDPGADGGEELVAVGPVLPDQPGELDVGGERDVEDVTGVGHLDERPGLAAGREALE